MTGTGYNDLKPGAQPVTFFKSITSGATNTLIWRVPWGNPVNKVFEPRKIIFTGPTNSGSSILSIWDQDLSSATPNSNGSAGAALITVPVIGLSAASGVTQTTATSIIDLNQMPQITFLAGLTCTAPIGSQVLIEGQVY